MASAATGALSGVGSVAGAIASTLLANELHRRLTFHADARVSWFTAQWEGGGLAGIGLVATPLALAGSHALVGEVSPLVQIGRVTGAIGLVRFVALRAWVFSTGSVHQGGPRDTEPTTVPAAGIQSVETSMTIRVGLLNA